MLAKDTGGNGFSPTPAGIYHAVCYGVIDLGTQHNPVFNNEQRKCIIMWELPEETIEIEGEQLPRAQSKMYTISLNEKATLRKDLEGWRGKSFSHDELKDGFRLKNLLGFNCQLNIVHTDKNGKTYANVGSIVPLKKGTAKITNKNTFVYFSFEEEMEIPEGIPEWIMNIIMKSIEYNTMGQQNDWENYEPRQEPSFDGPDDDIPF